MFGIHTPAPGLAHQRWRPTGPGKERTRGRSTHQPVGLQAAHLCGGTSQPQEATLAEAGNERPNAGARSPGSCSATRLNLLCPRHPSSPVAQAGWSSRRGQEKAELHPTRGGAPPGTQLGVRWGGCHADDCGGPAVCQASNDPENTVWIRWSVSSSRFHCPP